MTRDPIYDVMKELSKEKFDADRERFLQEAEKNDDGGWTKHTRYHWTRKVSGKVLDYWPSRKKWHYNGKTSRSLRALKDLIGGAQ